MPCIKFLDMECKFCDNILRIDLSKLADNFHCWQGIVCDGCKSYNHIRMRKEPFFEDERGIMA